MECLKEAKKTSTSDYVVANRDGDPVSYTHLSMLDTRALTGESVPRSVHKGDEALSGCMNQTGVLTIKTTKAFGESTASKIIDLEMCIRDRIYMLCVMQNGLWKHLEI